MRGIAAGTVLCLALLGAQGALIPPGASLLAGLPWMPLGLFWFCLWAPERQGVIVGFAAGWAWEIAGASPAGLLLATTAAAAAAAAASRRWVRHDAWMPAWLFTVSFTAGLLALQGIGYWIARPAAFLDVAGIAVGAILSAALAGVPLVWLLQRVGRAFLDRGHAEAFSR